MELTRSDIEDFKKLYAKYFTKHLNDSQAREKLGVLVRQMAVVYRPITRRQFEQLYGRHRKERR